MKTTFIKLIYKQLINRIYNPFLYTNIKPIEFIPKEGEKYLVIAPHPDDESIGCGGIISLYPDFIDVICLTHGKDDDIRKEEFYNAMNFAGVKNFKMLDLPDKNIINSQKDFNLIDISLYDTIFIPYIFDQHKDHKAVSILLSEKIKKSDCKKSLKIAFYEVWSTINMPQYYVNISSVANKKKEMINIHKSQVASKNYADKIIGLNSYRGLLKNIDAVEAFSILSVDEFLNLVSKLVYDI